MSLSNPYTKGQYGITFIDLKILYDASGQKLSIFFEEKMKGEDGPLQSYINTGVSPSRLKAVSAEIYSLMYASTYSPEYDKAGITKRLQQAGMDLYNCVFPVQIKKRLADACSENLYLTISESLLNIPWELAYDGEQFFCLRFNMGRRVYTSHPMVSVRSPEVRRLRMLILADPRNDLPKSYQEGDLLLKKLENRGDLMDVDIITTSIDSKMVSRQLFEYDILHYAGHAEYNQDNPDLSGWVLEDGILTAQRIMELAGCKRPLPALIFSNACQSGQTSEWSKKDQVDWGRYYAYDLVNAFLRSGVQHYIGTFQDVRDISGLSLGLHFYELMTQSSSIGEALRKARIQLIQGGEEDGKNGLEWAHYMLYGDPTTCYFRQAQTYKESGEFRQVRDIQEDGQADGQPAVISCGAAADTRAKSSSVPASDGSGYNSMESSGRITTRSSKGLHLSRGLGKGIAIGVIAIMLMFLFFIRYKGRPATNDKGGYNKYTDLEWEEKKWEIVERIMDKMRKGHNLSNSVLDKGALPPLSTKVFHGKYTLCIIPSDPVASDKDTELLIEELITFFDGQPDYTVVERQRLDFVIRELELNALNLTEDKLRFSFGEIFDARGILFVKTFERPGRVPQLTRRKEAFLRLVDTKTTAITGRASQYFDPHNIKDAGRALGEQIISSFEKRMEDKR
ncbi:CHAT domain-containing protein [bacterium]|nr:CHAT domain-containing protein [bacterium]